MTLLLAALAAAAYAVGGVFMKHSAGLTQPRPSLAVFALFVAGAALQTLSMRDSLMSSNYLIVLGLEAAIALALGVALLGEGLSLVRAAGVVFVVIGVAILRA